VEAFCKAEFAKRATLRPDESAKPQMWERKDTNVPQAVLDVFAKREDINVVLGDADPVVLSHKPKLLPFLDDFAQIVGVKMTTTPFANAVFTQDAVYYLGRDLAEAQAIRMVVHKNAITATMARSFATKPLNLFDRILMNAVFKLKYSKLKDKK
ncbi:MAG: hypothetical protein SPG61_05785, partial [Arcanobacterium sp.]|nr:hypothetical protein [Arcanobacterium sp.]